MTTPAYDPNNIFAKILRGEIPSHQVYEDEHTIAFMDVMPQTDGHTLVLPKVPSRGLLDADPAVLGPLFTAVQKVAAAVKTAFSADGLVITQFNEPAGGQTVFHLHVHILPRYEGVPLRQHARSMADGAVLAAQAEKIRAVLRQASSGAA
ncbi:HIT family protein [Methylobacterium nodulans]|uniref:Histidine triad (HIT) protein n=1 Tax=Methylobacterium nodulans (strain LMG 21967 / CNCM I-2342 / ORS 2060) TaxID=460265 RepID=B8IH02_METNO|nr:HIT family protein [Methylobacterium nodulans]ACL57877.1 histidine triad (HIT) protein [Methylobacterium nodulans ORS 2060]